MIREVEPPRPSTRADPWRADVGGRRAESPRPSRRQLASQLRGDLDWITMKALEKDRTRRYGDGQCAGRGPAPPSRRSSRSSPDRRARGIASASSCAAIASRRRGRGGVLVVLLGGLCRRHGGAGAADRPRTRPRQPRGGVAATQVSDFLVGLFKVSDPSEARGNTLTAREILDKGARAVQETLREQPEIQARLQTTMGTVYTNLGVYDAALSLLEQAVQDPAAGPGRRPCRHPSRRQPARQRLLVPEQVRSGGAALSRRRRASATDTSVATILTLFERTSTWAVCTWRRSGGTKPKRLPSDPRSRRRRGCSATATPTRSVR